MIRNTIALVCVLLLAGCEPTTSGENIVILQNTEQIDEDSNSRTIHVQIKNNSNDLVQLVNLKSVYYDKDGKIVGTGLGNGVNIAGGATKVIDVLAVDIDNAAKFEIEVDNVVQ